MVLFEQDNILTMKRHSYRKRVERLRETLRKEKLDGVLLSSRNDIFYYTGKVISRGDSGFLLLTKKSSTIFVSSIDKELEDPEVRVFKDLKSLKRDLRGHGKLGYDETNLSVSRFKKIKTGYWKPFSRQLSDQRLIKDRYEIEQLKRAARVTVKILNSLRLKGKTEFQVSTEIQNKIRLLGDTVAFDPVVAAGKNSAYIHHIPNKTRISRGFVLVDTGVKHNNYKADITRMFLIRPNQKERKMLEDCKAVQKELIDLVKPGVVFSSIQKRYEKLLKALGYTVFHSFGHGVGLCVHERPSGKDILKKGMVLTVEPGLYKKGLGGCRIEDMVLVDEKPVLLSKY
jgi:Xaa-Pro dipeptidase